MARFNAVSGQKEAEKSSKTSNVKSRQKYERFGETIRYLTIGELQKLFDSIDDYRHKLMLEMIYELGCRVGEFVRIKLKHLDSLRSSVYFPAENTKTRHGRVSCLPRGLMNELVSLLKTERLMGKKDSRMKKPEEYLFHPPGRLDCPYSENRLRQIFSHYVRKVGLKHEYAQDALGRRLNRFTIHSLRHSHIMHYIHEYKLPLPVVQKQVGHKTLKATSVYLNPSDEVVAEAYQQVRQSPARTRQALRGRGT